MSATTRKHSPRRLTAANRTVTGLLLVGTVFGVSTALAPAAGAATVTPIAADTFDRANAASWGKATTGQAYAFKTQEGTFTIANNKGVVKSLQPGKTAETYLPAVSAAEVLVKDTVTVPTLSTAGVYHTLQARRQSDGSNYSGRLHFAGSAVSVGINKVKGSTETRIGSIKLPLTVKAGQNITFELQVTGTTTVSVKVRAYVAGTTAPAWQYTTTDTSSSRIATAGSIGLLDYVPTAAPAATIVHEDFGAYNPGTTVTAPTTSTSTTTTTPTTSTSTSTTTAAPAPTVAPAAPVTGTVLRNATFETQPIGAVVPTNFITELGTTTKTLAAYDDMSIVSDGRGGKAIRTILRANTYKQSGSGDNGNNLFVNLPKTTYDNACISYDIRFDAKFGWSYGGKLPGLEGVAPGISPGTPSGGNSTTLGWSGRLMWLGPGSYSWAGPTNMAVSYMYHPGQTSQYGDNVRWNKPFVGGTWHKVKQCYVMNTVGKADGVLQSWMDGVQTVNYTNYVYRTRSDVHISHLMFTIFRGGSDANWASDHDGFVDIDNMVITTK